MAKFHFNNVAINGIACAVPTQRIPTTSYYEKFGKKNVDSFIVMTGIEATYRTMEEQTAADLCFVAAEKLIAHRKIEKGEIGALIFVTQTPDYRIPATSCVLQYRLGLTKECLAFDVNLGCSGYVYGIQMVASMLTNSDIKYGLLLCGDTCYKTGSPEDQSTCMMFGDAGSATLLSIQDDAKAMDIELMTDGNGFKDIITASGAYRNVHGNHERTKWGDGNIRSDYEGYINGTNVFSFSIREAPKIINRFVDEHQVNSVDYDALILHQANLFMLKQIAKKAKFPMEKVPLTLKEFGNTSSVSIPITLCSEYTTKSNRGVINVLACGFGVGLSWGIMNMNVTVDDLLPVIYTDEYYLDGGVSHD
jgi:3-oxoacyl-[acyl-carrier-protein] synthase III